MKSFEWYVEQYNMVRNSRRRAAFRFSKDSWESLMQYRKWEKEDAVKEALAKPKLQLLKDLRTDHTLLLCMDCRASGMWGGSAMTTWNCKECGESHLNGSTNTPLYCQHCAFNKFVCNHCGESMDKDLERVN